MVIVVLMLLLFSVEGYCSYSSSKLPSGTILNSKKAPAGTNLIITGTVVDPPPCKIEQTGKIDVPFNNGQPIPEDKIDGTAFAETIPIKFVCTVPPKGIIVMSIQGTATSFDPTAVQTNLPDLGIAISRKDSSQPIKINDWFDLSTNNNGLDPIEFTAIPVKKSNGDLSSGGSFEATAMLIITYK